MATSTRNQAWTVLELLNWTASHFQRVGIRNPRLNAELLLSKTLGLERIMLYARFDQQVTAGQRAAFRELVQRRAAREPLQYVLGEWEFCGRKFEVGPAVMVPRQETELVVEQCLHRIAGTGRDAWAADVCTGSGAIAVTLAAERSDLHVAATDCSAQALDVARANAGRHGVLERIAFGQGDLAVPVASLLPGGRTNVDLLVSNPPYVPTKAVEQLEPEVRDHEPRQALDGGADGLGAIRRLVPQAAGIIAPAGWLVMELGETQADAVRCMLAATHAFDPDTIGTTRDSGGCERVLCARRSAS